MLGKLMEETGEMEQGKGRDVGRKRAEKTRERVEERWGERQGEVRIKKWGRGRKGGGQGRGEHMRETVRVTGVGKEARGGRETLRKKKEAGKEGTGTHRGSQR